MNILIIPGSLRKDSFNKKLAALVERVLTEKGHRPAIFDLENIPLYNFDVQEAGLPEAVSQFKKAIEGAQLLVFCSPEYNYSISGVLKNALDWGSRPYGDNSFGGKVAAIMGVSNGRFGTVRAQFDLRKILTALDILVIPQPQLHVLNGDTAFTDDGKLSNQKDSENLVKLLTKAVEVATKLQS
jgi:chromate reductase, NAD(P)H dehydrogenase (quinone)